MLVLVVSTFAYAESIPRYNFHRAGLGEGRVPYETALATRLIEISQSKFGPAKIGFEDTIFNAHRTRKLIEKGRMIHFFSGGFLGRTNALTLTEAESIKFPPILVSEPILNNLLGYRRLIVRLEEEGRFWSVNSLDEFRRFKVGQGFAWTDVGIFKFNGIDVVEAEEYQYLFPMLSRKRFDYISLGVGEVDHPFSANPEFKNKFSVVEDIVIFYPFPVHFFVTPTMPELADRLEYALKQMKATGEFDVLFSKYFGGKISQIDRNTTKVFVLKSPDGTLSPEKSQPNLFKRATIIR
ncbi:MAG: hypothetical protein COA42_11135 [Alteromonadaceae bacterium]|nr:MAG: hypothetical protein COA42_11135 [Alteromonadaceae bacterium]